MTKITKEMVCNYCGKPIRHLVIFQGFRFCSFRCKNHFSHAKAVEEYPPIQKPERAEQMADLPNVPLDDQTPNWLKKLEVVL